MLQGIDPISQKFVFSNLLQKLSDLIDPNQPVEFCFPTLSSQSSLKSSTPNTQKGLPLDKTSVKPESSQVLESVQVAGTSSSYYCKLDLQPDAEQLPEIGLITRQFSRHPIGR